MPFQPQAGRSRFLAELLTDPQYQMGMQAYQAGGSTAPVQSGLEGLARALQGVAGGYFAGQARQRMQGREEAYRATLADALRAAEPWRNPDMDPEAGLSAALAAPADGRRYLAPGEVAAGTGGMEGLASVLARNPDTAELGFNARLADIAAGRKLQEQYALRGFEAGLRRAEDEQKWQRERSPENLDYLGRKAAAEYGATLPGRMAVAAAGKTDVNVTQKGPVEGMKASFENAAKAWDEATKAGTTARKNAKLYAQLEGAMAKFTTGALAEPRLALQALAKDVLGIKTEGLAEGQLYQAVSKRLELLATPRGQGQITENERAIIRETIPSITKDPQAVAMTLRHLRALDEYDLAVEKIYLESARRNGGTPNPVEVAESLQQLGAPPTAADIAEPVAAPQAPSGWKIERAR